MNNQPVHFRIFIINFGLAAKTKLIKIYNHSWVKRIVAQVWREATTIFIHKKEKSKSHTSSYRPISLASCVARIWNELSITH